MGGTKYMSNNTYTFSVPGELTEAIDKYCRLKSYSNTGIEVLSKMEYGTSRSPSITCYVLYSVDEGVIDQAVVDISKVITDYNNRPIITKPSFWQRLINWRLGRE